MDEYINKKVKIAMVSCLIVGAILTVSSAIMFNLCNNHTIYEAVLNSLTILGGTALGLCIGLGFGAKYGKQ